MHATPESPATETLTIERSSPLAEVAKNVAALSASAERTFAPKPWSALPDIFYAGISELKLNADEEAALRQCEEVPSEAIEVRPDGGFIYVSHTWLRKQLTDVFGRGQWALRPVSDAGPATNDPDWLYQAWALFIRGHFVGHAIGCVRWVAGNSRTNYGDAMKIAESDALSRIVSTSSLQLGVNVRDKRFAQTWRKEHCIRVNVRTHKGMDVWWRRKDADPFEDKDGRNIEGAEVKQATPLNPQSPPSGKQSPPKTDFPKSSREAGAIAIAPGKGDDIPESQSPQASRTGERKDASPPSQEQPRSPEPIIDKAPANPSNPLAAKMVTEGQIRLFWAEAKRRGIIKMDVEKKELSYADGLYWLCTTLDLHAKSLPTGKTPAETIVGILRAQTQEQFSRIILTALRAK